MNTKKHFVICGIQSMNGPGDKNKRVIVKYEIVADVPELKKLIFEFGKIGNNLNQLPATSMLEAYTLWKCGKQSDKGFLIFLK